MKFGRRVHDPHDCLMCLMLVGRQVAGAASVLVGCMHGHVAQRQALQVLWALRFVLTGLLS